MFLGPSIGTNLEKYLLSKNVITLSVFMLEESYLYQNGIELNFLFT